MSGQLRKGSGGDTTHSYEHELMQGEVVANMGVAMHDITTDFIVVVTVLATQANKGV